MSKCGLMIDMYRVCGDDGELCSRCQEVALLRRELDRLRALLRRELDRLRAANARLQAWHDAVMGQERHSLAAVPYAYSPGFVPPEHAMTIKTAELIIRPQPLAKE